MLALAKRLKAARHAARPFEGPQAVAIIFDKPTLRTQASFTAGVAELGGYPMLVDGSLAQIGTRESVADTARVLGRMVSAIVWRTFGQERIDGDGGARRGARRQRADRRVPPVPAAGGPADHRGAQGRRCAGLTVAFLGDAASNMSHSFLLAGSTAGMHVRVSGPAGFAPDAAVLDTRRRRSRRATGGSATYVVDPVEAVTGADVVVTDTWVSMGKEDEAEERSRPFRALRPRRRSCWPTPPPTPSCCTACPPTAARRSPPSVIDGPRSVVWDEAENRLHAQKALLAWLMEHQP